MGEPGCCFKRKENWREKRLGHTQKARATGEGLVRCLVSQVERTEDPCPLGTLSPSPSYSYSPYFSSSSTGCKSKSGRHKRGGAVIILYSPLALATSFLAYAQMEYCAQPVGAHSNEADTKKLCLQFTSAKLTLSTGSSVCSASKLHKNIFLINFFSYKGHLNDI